MSLTSEVADAEAVQHYRNQQKRGGGGDDDKGGKSARMWLGEIERAEKRQQKWIDRGRKIIKRYRDERNDGSSEQRTGRRRLNILWSNVQTLWPSLYARKPEPICERRFLDHDPVGRVAATIWERAIRYSIEDNGFDDAVRRCVLDYLLPGRGQIWVRYEPKFAEGEAVSPDEQGGSPYDDSRGEAGEATPGPAGGDGGGDGGGADSYPASGDYAAGGAGMVGETLEYEYVCVDYVHWEDFLHSQARVWEEVTWVARRVFMGKSELKKRFGAEVAKKVPLERPRDANGRFQKPAGEANEITKAEVFEIWCKETKEVHFVARGYDRLLEPSREDPLHLEGFWPCPRPLYATLTNDELIPVPDFAEYQDQAEEIDQLTNRIASLTRSLKVAGVYDAAAPGLARLLDEGVENKLVPVNNWAAFAEKNGLQGAISFLPIKDVAAVLLNLIEAREQCKHDLYEITGIADIIRGQSDPRETLGAQQIKGNFATQRLSFRQNEVARFARDAIKIVGEVIAEQCSPQTLIEWSSIMQDEGVEGSGAAGMVPPGQPGPGAAIAPPPPSLPGPGAPPPMGMV